VAYLFLYPKGELFGVVYVSDSSSKVYTVGEYSPDQLKEINVSTTNFDIIVDTDSTETVRAYIKTKVTGLALKKNSTTEFGYFYDDNKKSLTLALDEARGWLSANDSYIKLVVPKNLMSNKLNLKLSTKKKTNITIYGNGVAKLSTLDVVINRGELYYDGLEAENIFIKANKAKISTGGKVEGTTNYLSLDINNSSADFLNAGTGGKYIDGFPEIDKVDYKVENLVIKSATRKSNIKLFNCGFMYTAPSCKAEDGNIRIYYLGKADIKSVDTEIEIYKLLKSERSSFNFSGEGGLYINENNSALNVTTNSGDVVIKTSNEAVLLETKKGYLNVQKARKPVSLITYKGSANIQFDKDAENGSYTVDREITSLRTYSGNIKIYGVEKINGLVDEGGDPSIEIHFNRVKDVNTLDVENANIKIVVPENEPITLDLTCDHAMLDIDVGTATAEGLHNGKFVRTVYASTSSNYLKITSSGNVNIISKDIYELKK